MITIDHEKLVQALMTGTITQVGSELMMDEARDIAVQMEQGIDTPYSKEKVDQLELEVAQLENDNNALWDTMQNAIRMLSQKVSAPS